jgi:hypothetical protein
MNDMPIETGFFTALEQIRQSATSLTGDRHLAAMHATRRVHELLLTPTKGARQAGLLLSAAKRELEDLKNASAAGMTGDTLLGQAEEAGLVHIYMTCIALAGSLNRSLEKTRRRKSNAAAGAVRHDLSI